VDMPKNLGEQPNRREFLTMLGAGTALTMLAGCGESNKLTHPATVTNSNKQLEGQLVISLNVAFDKGAQALTEAYKQVQPKVKLIWDLPGSSVTDYGTWLGTQLAAGNVRADIVSGNYVPSYRNYVNFDEYRTSINPYMNQPWDQTLNWDFFADRGTSGARTTLATRSVHIMWFYNKEIFAKAGVQPPTTWDEFADVCAKIKAIGVTPVAINYGYQLPQWLAEIYFDQYHIDWIDQVRAQEGDWDYDPNLDGKFKLDPKDPNIHSKYTLNTQRFLRGIRDGKLRFDTPAVADMVQNMVKLFPKYATNDVFVIQDTYTPFLQQKVAMTVDGTWELGNLYKDMQSLSPDRLKTLNIPAGSVKSFDWDTFENPPMQGPLVNSPARSIESAVGEYLSIINKNQQQVNLAIDFLQFWTCQKGYKPYNDAEAQSSTFAPGGPLQVRGVQDPHIYQQYFSKVKQTGNAEVSYNHEWLYWGGGNIERDVRNMYQQALQGQLTPAGFGKALQQYLIKNFDALLKQYQLTPADLDNVSRQPGS
jgi:raffinose/stachyose/melibiose transport system substrate-binding protein